MKHAPEYQYPALSWPGLLVLLIIVVVAAIVGIGAVWWFLVNLAEWLGDMLREFSKWTA